MATEGARGKKPLTTEVRQYVKRRVKKVEKKTKRALRKVKELLAQPLDQEHADKLVELYTQLRSERVVAEQATSDIVVVHADGSLPAGSVELQTLSNINLGQLATMLAPDDGAEPPLLEVVRQFGTTVAMRANDTALRMVRRSSPGLRISSAAYLYPQHLRPMGEELAKHGVKVIPGEPTWGFGVSVVSSTGQPVPGVHVTVLLDWLNSTVDATTDGAGEAKLAIPTRYPEALVVMAEPKHSHWAKFSLGFQSGAAPARLDFVVESLFPDNFGLMAKYAAYDPTAGQGVTIGVIDSGVGPHVDLTLAGGACVVTGDDSNDFSDNGIGHGTHVAGIIAARQTANGVYGLAPACKLMSYRVCPKTGDLDKASSVDVAAAIYRAISDKCDMVNISLGSPDAMPELPVALEAARDAGMLVFVATGNDSKPMLRYPARYSHTLAVGALGYTGTYPPNSPDVLQVSNVKTANEFVALFSNRGMGVDFIGVGVGVLSTYPGDLYAKMSGTSMATPYTTGMAARLLSSRAALLNMPKNAARTDAIIDALYNGSRRFSWPNDYAGFGIVT